MVHSAPRLKRHTYGLREGFLGNMRSEPTPLLSPALSSLREEREKISLTDSFSRTWSVAPPLLTEEIPGRVEALPYFAALAKPTANSRILRRSNLPVPR